MIIIKEQNLKKAIIYSIAYGILSSFVALVAKLAAPHTNNYMIVFFRFGVSFFYLACIYGIQSAKGRQFKLSTTQPGMHIMRATSSFLCQMSFFYSLKFVPLVDANLLYMTNPLFIPILGAIFLKIKTSAKNWLAIIIGFMGIIFVLQPSKTMFNNADLFALAGGFFAAVSLLGVHEIAKKDSPYTIMFYYFSITFAASSILVLFNWQTPDTKTILLLLSVGLLTTLCQECTTRALINAPAKIVSPLFYTSIVFSGLFDWLIWHSIPNLLSIIGMGVIIASTVLIAKTKI